jgi:S-DNA-T family DNA segregation ATPase FtsK/SpoIIIE
MFEINVAEGTRVDRIRALEDDLAIRLKVPSVRIVAPIPGKSTIGIEVPNRIRETVCLRELITAPEYNSANFAIPLFLGKDAAGRALIEDLAKMPHLLVAGATGAGKSVCLNSIIMSILFSRTPDQCKMILIDPKMVELSLFENIPHLACPVVRDMNRAAQILEWACQKMDERYEIMAEVGARNIFAYNKISDQEKRTKLSIADDDETFEPKMPFIVIVVDELADLMMVSAKDVENSITRLAQKSRAVGIHIILATQRPSTNVITGLIKANLPTRISFQVASKIDSRVVLDQNGAEKLLGFGDMLYLPPRTSMLARGQGAFVADDEIRKTVDCIKVQQPQYARDLIQREQRSEVDPLEIDELYGEAVRFVCETKRGSASLLQRRFSIGYTRASRLIDLMAGDGVLGEYKNAQAREVLMTLEEYEDRQEKRAEG